MIPLFITIIVGTAIIWRLGCPTPRSIFPPHQRAAIIRKRREQERAIVDAAQERAREPHAYGPLSAEQRRVLDATLSRMKGCEMERAPQSLPEAA